MKKLPVLCFVLAGFAVRCDDNNYYIIRMLEETRGGRPFDVYWNVPTVQCRSKKIPFDNLDAFGIIQNDLDSFRGTKIAILYDPGRFPALLKNETTGKFKFRNAGVPQEGNLTLHLDSFKDFVLQSIPDEGFNGVAVIDFESWKPVLRQNFGELVPYKDISYEIERKKHRWWLEAWVKEEARSRFEESGRVFMQNTISLAKKLRPHATWGYYGFPYCYNMAADKKEDCAPPTQSENDRTYWLWSESSALYPSVYSSKSLTTTQLTSLVKGRVNEAARHVRKHSRILPYVWYRYRDGGFLSQNDLAAILETLFKSEVTGLIIWGSSNDVKTVHQCEKLHHYIYNVLGPAIAKYTKRSFKDDSYTVDSDNSEGNDVLNVDKITIDKDPEFDWIPPVNYTQDIQKYVNDEYKDEKVDDSPETGEELALIDLINKVYKQYDKDVDKKSIEGNNNITSNNSTVVESTTLKSEIQSIHNNSFTEIELLHSDTDGTSTQINGTNLTPQINRLDITEAPIQSTISDDIITYKHNSTKNYETTTHQFDTSTNDKNDQLSTLLDEELINTSSTYKNVISTTEDYESLVTETTTNMINTESTAFTQDYGIESTTDSLKILDTTDLRQDIDNFDITTSSGYVLTDSFENFSTTEATTELNEDITSTETNAEVTTVSKEEENCSSTFRYEIDVTTSTPTLPVKININDHSSNIIDNDDKNCQDLNSTAFIEPPTREKVVIYEVFQD